MKRSGFAPRRYQTPPPAPPRRALRAGVITLVEPAAPRPKALREVSTAYRNLVRQLPCAHCGHLPPNQFCHADEGKGLAWKTDDRRGWPGCGPRGRYIGCHALLGSSGQFSRAERRRLETAYGAATRRLIVDNGLWPKELPLWTED